MAKRTGLPTATIASIERSPTASPSLETASRAAAGLGCAIEDLLGASAHIPAPLQEMLDRSALQPAPTPEEIQRLARARVILGREPSARDYHLLLLLLRS